MSATAPAPRVVYQSRLFVIAQCDAPDTAEPVLVEELTPLDGCRLLDELDDDEFEDVDADDDVVEELDVCVVEEAVPGLVAALTAPITPTPARARIETLTVMRLSKPNAASRAAALTRVTLVVSMGDSLASGSEPFLGTSLELAGNVEAAKDPWVHSFCYATPP